MQAPSERESQAAIRLRLRENGDESVFDLYTRIIGSGSDAARGALIHMDRKTVGRAREGIVGETFIANVLHYLGEERDRLAEFGLEPRFENLFEVVAPDREPVAA